MPLFDPAHRAEAARSMPPESAAAIVHAFHERVQDYADAKVAEKRAALASACGQSGDEVRRKLADWDAFARFNRHTIGEIETGRLDGWLREIVAPSA
jgi:hypothetical protein